MAKFDENNNEEVDNESVDEINKPRAFLGFILYLAGSLFFGKKHL